MEISMILSGTKIYRGFICGIKNAKRTTQYPIRAAINLYLFLIKNYRNKFLSKKIFCELHKDDLQLNYNIKTNLQYRYFFHHIALQAKSLFTYHPHFGIYPVDIDLKIDKSMNLDIYQKYDSSSDDLLNNVENNLNLEEGHLSYKEILIDLLDVHGPMKRSELNIFYAKKLDIDSQRTWRILGYVLSQNEEFYILLPGWVGLLDHVNNIDQYIDCFLNEDVLIKYISHFYGSRLFNPYPAYTMKLEQNLVKWSENNANSKNYSALLFIADIKSWSLNQEEKEFYLKQKNNSKFELHEPVGNVSSIKKIYPELQTIFDQLNIIKSIGFTSYAILKSVSKKNKSIFKNENTSHELNLNLLMFLILMGAVKAPSDYLLPHKKTDTIDTIIKPISKELIENGILTWESDVGRVIKDKINSSLDLLDLAETNSDWISSKYFEYGAPEWLRIAK